MANSSTKILATLQGAFTGKQAQVLHGLLIDAQADAATVNTALGALAAKLNADGGVTDTDYAAATLTSDGI
jgi:hypothetical protein